jgi:tRNA-specific 2-thiouridylase
MPRPGAIVDSSGTTLGEHDGHWTFTPGQRKGIGVSAAKPLYVLQSDARTNTVTVGGHDELARSRVVTSGTLYADVDRADVKLRYRSQAVGAAVARTPGGFDLVLDEPAYGVARGQAAVLYEGDAVVGCGLISSADCN